ncbi:hypothetical protein ACJRO7_001688 [Eucalyptus globulus]|uniref:HMG box domain-containing protein n=1 Tax=Eucalyptus globulus TaxID=34317 RepID=A0ABD3LXG0_EUCGL
MTRVSASSSRTLKPRKDGKSISKKKGVASSSGPARPKRPPIAFLLFMEDFRKSYKEEHPENKSVSAVAKAGGERWKSMSLAEKSPYIGKAVERKVDYDKAMESYNENENVKEDEAEPAASSEKSTSESTPEVEDDEEDSS